VAAATVGARPPPAGRVLIDDKPLPVGTNRCVAIVAESVRTRDALCGSKRSDLAESRNLGAAGLHATVKRSPRNPDAARPRRDRGRAATPGRADSGQPSPWANRQT